MNKSYQAIMCLFIALVSGISGYVLYQARFIPGSLETTVSQRTEGTASLEGMLRPDFNLPDLAGRRHGPGEWSGKVLVLNFWASWCPPCLKEIPAFIRLQEKYAGRGIQFVGIALQTAEEIRDFVIAKGINYPVLAGEEEVIRVAEDYGNQSGTLPYTVFIDRDQRIAFIKHGPISEVEAEKVISSMVIN